MLGFVFGAIAGAVAATYWHRELRTFRDEQMPRLRQQTAEKVDAAERAIVDAVNKVSTQARSRLRSQPSSTEGRPAPTDRIIGPR